VNQWTRPRAPIVVLSLAIGSCVQLPVWGARATRASSNVQLTGVLGAEVPF
jgi:hypothetical protein